ncbi:protein sneaky [Aphis craccivora]|uniref:Protein sneaky n=1 Tax=Aphis craccivora TaxID=307492 RepID=A0A6G0YS28_APHCR|nr:protein sneaky [Aphis craccivora]
MEKMCSSTISCDKRIPIKVVKVKSYIKLDVHQNLISDPTLHNHNSDDNTHLNRQKRSNVAKRKISSDLSSGPSKIINGELSADKIITFTVNDVHLVRKNIYNTRRSILPKISLNKEDVHNVLQEHPVLTAEMPTHCSGSGGGGGSIKMSPDTILPPPPRQ